MAIPKGLVSREMLTQMNGIKSSRTSIIPANSSGTFSPGGNSRVIIQVPSFENSFINTKRSYIHFKLQATGTDAASAVLTPGAPVFRRLLLKNSRGQVLSDIDNYDVLCRVMNNMKSTSEMRTKASVSHDSRADLWTAGNIDTSTDYASNPKTVIHELQDGLLGTEQDFLIPVSALVASAGHAFQLELWLNEAPNVFCGSKVATKNFSYQLSDVAFDMELVEVTPELMNDINGELANGSSIPVPYRSIKSYVNQISSGQSYKAQISEMSHDVESVFTVLRPQLHTSRVSLTDTTAKATSTDPYRFVGGRFNIGDANATTDGDTIVKKYNYRYGSKYYPLAPVNLDYDSTLALQNVISGFELDEKVPFLAEKLIVGTKKIPRFETDTFVLAQNFKTTGDSNLRNGINTSNTGAPIELDLSFNASVNNIEAHTFVVSTQTLYIKMNGQSSVLKD